MRLGSYHIGRYKDEQTTLPPDLLRSVTLADSALYTHYSIPYYNPSKLYEKTGGYDLYDEMREDDQISAILGLIKYIILGVNWQIESEHKEVVEFIEDDFNNLDEIFAKKLYNILSGIDYGFSLTEKIYKEEGGKIHLSALKTRMPHNMDFVLDDYGNILKILQSVTGPAIEIDPQKLMHFVYKGEFDNPYGSSAMNKGVYRAYWSKNAIIKFWNIYLERHGMPLGVGTYPSGASAVQISDLKKVGKNLQSKTFANLPEGFSIDFKEASKGTDNYEKAIDKYNMQMARAMLFPDLLGLSGSETGGGSYSLGEKQFEIFYTAINFIQEQIERQVTKDIVEELVFYNFGEGYKAKFKFNIVDETKKRELLNIWLQAVNGGKIPVTDTHINWFLQSVEAPEIEEAELNKIQEEKDAAAAAIRGEGDPKTDDKDEDKKDEATEEEEEVAPPKGKELTEPDALRKFAETIWYDKNVNYTAIEAQLNDIEDNHVEDLAQLYKLSINALVDDIKSQFIIEKKKFNKIEGLELKHQLKIKRQITMILTESYKAGFGSIEKSYIIDDTVILNDDDIAAWAESYAQYVSDMEAGFILGKIKPALIEGIRGGAGVKEIVKMIEDVLKGYDITLDAHRIEAMVRTITSTGYNEGRAQLFDTIKGDIIGYQYSAILDGRETALCHRLHGKILKPTDLSRYNPPNHFNCRSIVVPIFKEEKFDGIFNIPAVQRTNGNFVELV